MGHFGANIGIQGEGRGRGAISGVCFKTFPLLLQINVHLQWIWCKSTDEDVLPALELCSLHCPWQTPAVLRVFSTFQQHFEKGLKRVFLEMNERTAAQGKFALERLFSNHGLELVKVIGKWCLCTVPLPIHLSCHCKKIDPPILFKWAIFWGAGRVATPWAEKIR